LHIADLTRASAVSLLFALLVQAACARHGAEQVVLEQFFNASRLRDRTALQKVSTVVFEPLQQGTVTAFAIKDVAEVEGADGKVTSRQVTVSAPVRLPDDQTAEKTIIVILQRGDGVATAQWMVTGFVVR
jgi:hypothetical protein